jgi:hypothetical protein
MEIPQLVLLLMNQTHFVVLNVTTRGLTKLQHGVKHQMLQE